MAGGTRHEGRRRALIVLYAGELNDSMTPLQTEEDLISFENKAAPEVREFAQKLLALTTQRKMEIDALIEQSGTEWTLARMACIDRSVLRIAVAELLDEDPPPVSVVINEAVELAKEFGADNSARFVNGVLDGIAKQLSRLTTPQI